MVKIFKNPNGDTRTAPKNVTFEEFQEANDMPLDKFIIKVDGVAEFLKSEIRICDKRLEEEPSPYYDGVNVGFTNAQELTINHIRFCKKLLEMMNFEQ